MRLYQGCGDGDEVARPRLPPVVYHVSFRELSQSLVEDSADVLHMFGLGVDGGPSYEGINWKSCRGEMMEKG